MGSSYKQNVKELSRNLIWNHSIDSLTKNREASRILTPTYLDNLWGYAFNEHLLNYGIVDSVDDNYIKNWHEFSNQTYGVKEANELKVAYLCGPEPENDLIHLLNLGVRIENIYAFESDKEMFNTALESLKDKYPTLKIFKGKIDHFFNSSYVKFDIIYLDFTSSLFGKQSKVYQTIIRLFESQALSNLSCLIVNTCFPDKSEENVDFLTKYFHNQAFYEYPIYDSTDPDAEGRFVENNVSYDILFTEDFKPYVDKNFREAYSAFQTNFVINYTNHILPITNILKSPILFSRLFTVDQKIIKEQIKKLEENETVFLDPSWYALYHFCNELKDQESGLLKSWEAFILEKRYGGFSMDDAIKFFYMELNAPTEGFMNILSDSLKAAIPKIMENIPDRSKGKGLGLFCDIPMIHLWLEIAINQLGYGYHQNTKNHKRFSYTAKEREMCIDIFTFDQCRSLYDWLPMVEYYGDDLKIIERQMMTRICVDAIAKHSLHILQNQYYGAHIVCTNDTKWSDNHYFKNREDLGKED